MKKFAPFILVAGLALAGCSSSTDEPSSASETATPAPSSPSAEAPPAESPTADADASEEYAFATGMTFGKVSTSGKPGPELEAFLDHAAEVTGEAYEDDLSFWSVTIDNREGTDAAFPNELRVYDQSGEEYLFARSIDFVEAVNEALPDAPANASADSDEWKAYEERMDLYRAAFDAEDSVANPGAVKEFVVVSADDLPSELTKLTIDLGGMIGEADVITLEDAESQGYPLDF